MTSNNPHRAAFVLAATKHGCMIVNRLDQHQHPGFQRFGVGYETLELGGHSLAEVGLVEQLLTLRRGYFGDGVVALDAGANIGGHTIPLAKAMRGWGSIIAVEAQERVFYALAGNIALNNCFNARALHRAVGAAPGTLTFPRLDHQSPATFGSFELRKRVGHLQEDIGQPIRYGEGEQDSVEILPIDRLDLPRLDLLKIDVEGMEAEALQGAHRTLERCRPLIVVEHIKAGAQAIADAVRPLGYACLGMGGDLLCVHETDPSRGHIEAKDIDGG